jgi:hypothetical protein
LNFITKERKERKKEKRKKKERKKKGDREGRKEGGKKRKRRTVRNKTIEDKTKLSLSYIINKTNLFNFLTIALIKSTNILVTDCNCVLEASSYSVNVSNPKIFNK